MRDYLNIGPTPPDEPCAQVGEEDYRAKAHAECYRYIERIRAVCGDPPEGARLGIKGFEHDFGRYYEVVCWFDEDYPESVEYAYRVEGEGPTRWRDEDENNCLHRDNYVDEPPERDFYEGDSPDW